MKNTYHPLEAVLLLESFARKRSAKLNDIAITRLMSFEPRKPAKAVYLGEIQHDNILTDIEIRQHFLKRGVSLSSEVTELHLKRCIDSDVALCRCMPDRALQGQGEPI